MILLLKKSDDMEGEADRRASGMEASAVSAAKVQAPVPLPSSNLCGGLFVLLCSPKLSFVIIYLKYLISCTLSVAVLTYLLKKLSGSRAGKPDQCMISTPSSCDAYDLICSSRPLFEAARLQKIKHCLLGRIFCLPPRRCSGLVLVLCEQST